MFSNAQKIRLVSFDVFDTLIARRCGSPEKVFYLTAEKLQQDHLLDLTSTAFLKMRVKAERQARAQQGVSEITLAKIYQELNGILALSPAVLEQFMNCELTAERETLFAIPGAEMMLRKARGIGRVVFVSDMYLPEDFLRSTLINLNLLATGEHLYVSSRWGVSKACGALFRVMLEQEKVEGKHALHIGDSFNVDFRQARKNGIQSIHLSRGTLNHFESSLDAAAEGTFQNGTTLAGIARIARLETCLSDEQPVPARLGASVAGPLLTLYAEWVLRSAVRRKLKTLYFLARDGEALLRLCEILAPATGASEIKLKYLYGSRQAWYPAALLKLDDAAGDFFASHVALAANTWEDCVGYLGFSAKDFTNTLLAKKWAKIVSEKKWRKQIFHEISTHADYREKLVKWLRGKADITARYLRQEGLIGSESSGLVDCGWSGVWTDILGVMIEKEGGRAPQVFFLGQRKRDFPSQLNTSAYLFDHQTGAGLKSIPDFFHVVVEFLLTANHGRTEGFTENDGLVAPNLASCDWQGFTPDSWREYRRALLRFAGLYSVAIADSETMVDMRQTLVELVTRFWERPTIHEAKFFAAHAIGLSPSRQNHEPLARAYGISDLLRLFMQLRLPGYPPFWWHEGAQKLSNPFVRIPMGLIWEAIGLARAFRFAYSAGADGRDYFQLCVCSGKKLHRGWQRGEENNLRQLNALVGTNSITDEQEQTVPSTHTAPRPITL